MDVQLLLLLAMAATGATLLWARRRARSAAPAPVAGVPRLLAAAQPWAAALFPVLLAVLAVRAFVIEPYRIPTGSMAPTLVVGDYVFVSKFAYGVRLPVLNLRLVSLGGPRHGDVLVFVPPHESRYFIKRVVGLPGDRVRYVGGELYVNGHRSDIRLDAGDDAGDGVQRFVEVVGDTPHLIQRVVGLGSREGEWLVPPDRYFMLGDNRDMSEDSRYWGYVAGEQIVGRAVAIWAHKAPGWALPTFARNGMIH